MKRQRLRIFEVTITSWTGHTLRFLAEGYTTQSTREWYAPCLAPLCAITSVIEQAPPSEVL